MEAVEHFIDCLTIYDFDYRAAEEYALIRVKLEKKGEVIGGYDLHGSCKGPIRCACYK